MVFIFVCVFSVMGQEKKAPALLNALIGRSVSVETDGGHGTGVVVIKGIVLTNFHLLNAGSGIKVDGKEATILKADPKNDLLLLAADTAQVTPLVLALEITQDEEVIVVGNPLGHKRMISRGRVIDITESKIYIDAHIFLGSSGSGAFNADGALIGIVVAIEGGEGDGFPFGIVIPALTIYKFFPKRLAQ